MKILTSRRALMTAGLALGCGCLATGCASPQTARSGPFICPPCGCAMDGHEFGAPGQCPACGMELAPAPQAALSVADMRRDLDFLYEKILAQHANPFLYISEREFERRYQQELERLERPLDRIEFYRRAARLASALRDGHTLMEPPLDAFRLHGRSSGVFALDVRFIGERLFVVRDLSGAGLAPGAEITAIDGRTVPEIVSDFRELITDVHPLFDVYARLFRELLWLRYGGGDDFSITTGGNSRRVVIAPARPLDVAEQGRDTRQEAYRFDILPDDVGLLTIDSFSPSPGFEPFLERCFTRLRAEAVDELIIDIRRNGGGSGRLAQHLMSYLTAEPYTLIDGFFVRVTEDLQALYRRADTHTDVDTRNVVLNNRPGSRVDALAESGPVRVTPEPRAQVFRGRVYVLTGNNTLSAAAMFAAMAKCNSVAEIVGAEPGQTTKFLADALPLTMPHSGLAFTVSFSEIHMPCEQSYVRGIQPNYPAIATPSDLEAGRDVALDTALALIANRRTR